MSTNPRTLQDWLDWQQSLSAQEIHLGLDRVRAVWEALGAPRVAPCVITVAGTNGKGSSIACLEHLAQATGLSVARYTSPHLLAYNERIVIAGECAPDRAIVDAFAEIDAARGDTHLSYFEFGTLAALLLFARSAVDVALLEVGLGGRLDAVNIIDADAALLTSVGMDHTDYLGETREAIGWEKAHVFRSGALAVCADPDPPASVRSVAMRLGAHYLERGRDFSVAREERGWYVQGVVQSRLGAPSMPAHLADNYAGAVVLASQLDWHWPGEAAAALGDLVVPGRLEVIGEAPTQVVDVGHNPDAAAAIAQWLKARPETGVRAVLGMLRDKDAAAFAAELEDRVEHWYLAPLGGQRGSTAQELAARLGRPAMSCHSSVAEAWTAAVNDADSDGLVIALGSFHTVEEVLRAVRL